MGKEALATLLVLALCACAIEARYKRRHMREVEEDSKNGYIFTGPRSLKTGNDNEFQLQRFGKRDSGTLTIQVYYTESYNGNETLAAEQVYQIEQGEKISTVHLELPSFDNYVYNGRIQMNGTFGDYDIGGTDKVYFSNVKPNIVLVQTDKPLYKPGQEVKFRVLKLSKDLKPSGQEDDLAEVYVEDPKGTRLFQFNKVDLGKGLTQLEFPLSEEPVLGTWKINVVTKTSTDSGTFDVKEYVLPKYDVKITFPPFVLANADSIPVEICAKYTYGKPVVGTLNLNTSVEAYSWSREKNPVLQETIQLDGCYKYEVNVSLIEPGSQYRYRRIMVVANVVEDGTGVERNETQYLQRQYSPLNLNFNSEQRQYFKPGLPFNGKLQVNNPDDTPAPGEEVEVCATIQRQRVISQWWATRKTKVCKNYTADATGTIRYRIIPQNVDSVSIYLEAKSPKYARDNSNPDSRANLLNQPSTSMSLSPYYSPSGSFLQLEHSGKPLPCGSQKHVRLLFTSKKNADHKFYYEIIKQGAVVRKGSVKTSFNTKDDVSSRFQNDDEIINGRETQLVPPPSNSADESSSEDDDCPAAKESKYTPPIGEAKIPIDIDASLSPSFNLLVYYVREDRETVADSQKIEVEKCFQNEVEFKFGDREKQPGTKTKISVKASPNSLCGLKLVDRSISLLDSSNQLTKDKIFQLIQDQDTGYYYSNNPCNENVPQPGLYAASTIIRPPVPNPSSSYTDSLAAFQDAGFLVISDLVIFTRPCQNANSGYGGSDGYNSGFSGPGGAEYETGEYLSAEDDFEPEGLFITTPVPARAFGPPGGAPSPTQSVVEVRDYFPETWLFELGMTGPDGIYEDKDKLPHTITTWDGSAVCVNQEDGLGISNTDSIKGFQAFFLSTTLPVSVVRGEEFWITVSVFSYADAALPVTVSLDHPAGFEVVGDSVDGDVCVLPGTSAALKVKLRGTELGSQNITLRAETAASPAICGDSPVSSALAKDAVTNPLEVKAEGFPAESVTSVLFCPKDEENQKYTNTFNLELPDDVVPDSTRAVIDVTGNVMGPAIQNLDSLVSLPTGCGEQNMVKFTPNYFVLDYLTDIGKLTDAIRKKAVRNLETGYQRELTYKHADGSFSAFGPVDREGSMFLTCFVLRSFHQAKRYITVDDSLLDQMSQFIVGKQQEDGCFPNVGRIIDRGLQGGLEKEKSSGSITAYCLSSLLISGYDNETVISGAQNCLKEDNQNLTPYQTFLYAYSDALAGNNGAATERLEGIKGTANKTDGIEYYNNPNGTNAVNLETAAYAVLTTLKTGGSAQDALPLVRYMTQNLNPNGGFYSTQDTCVGLDALGQFAKLVYKDPVDLVLTLSGALSETVGINEDSKLLVQRNIVHTIPGDLNVEATGAGCGLIQTSLRYNTKSPPQKLKFYLEVVGTCQDGACKKATLNVHAIYLPEQQRSGMAVITISMLSGVVPNRESLETLQANKETGVMRFDVENNKVNLYFNEITNAGKKFSFDVDTVVQVDNAQPAEAKVFDYYAPENEARTSYLLNTPGAVVSETSEDVNSESP